MRPLNILYVGTLPPHPGGSAISGYQLLGCLARLGHAVRSLAHGFRVRDEAFVMPGFGLRHLMWRSTGHFPGATLVQPASGL